jgi:hypothetical protein
MSLVQIRSVEDPFDTPELSGSFLDALTLVEAMGLLPESEVFDSLSPATARRLAEAVGERGIAQEAIASMLSALVAHGRDAQSETVLLRRALEAIKENLEGSPMPQFEWQSLSKVFDADDLAKLLETSTSSLRRYMSGARSTPDDIAERLHYLARIVGDLRGSYNDIGIRRWFSRKRTALDGKTPSQLLMGQWRPDDSGPERVRALARSLVASPAT